MKLVGMKCPNCAAQMQVQPAAQTATCEYCGTTSAVQRRTRFFERVVPPQRELRQMPVVTLPHSRAWTTRVIAMSVVTVGAAVGFPIMMQSRIGKQIQEATRAATTGAADYKRRYQWQGMATPVLSDVDGDGAADVIGRARYVHQDDTIAVAAWSGETGEQLWESPRYGNYSDTYQGKLAVIGDSVLVTDTRGNVTRIDRVTGNRTWQVSVGEKVDRLCAEAGDAVAIELADDTWQRLALADGAASAQIAGECAPVWMDGDGGNPGAARLGWRGDYVTPRGFDGIKVDAHVYLQPDGPFVGLGYKHKGTRVPMVALYDGELTKRRRRGRSRDGKFALLWRAQVPAGDPFAAKEGAPEHVAFGTDRVFVAYEMKDSKPHRVVALSLADGTSLWDTSLTPGSGLVLEGIIATPTRVFVSMWGRLEVLDATSGKRLYAIGTH